MFKNEITEKVYSDARVGKIPVLYVTQLINVFAEIMESVKEENPYGTISELFDE